MDESIKENGLTYSDNGNDGVLPSITLRCEESDVDVNKPWHDDVLNRKDIALRLTSNIVSGEKNSLMVALDGGWGSGKTFMLKRWAAQLNIDGYNSFYFNAWETDYSKSPLLALAGKFIGYISDELGLVANTKRKFSDKSLLDWVKSLSEESIDKIPNTEIKKLLGAVLFMCSDETLKRFANEGIDTNELKKAVRFASKLLYQKSCKPLVIIIDELDRCRPNFALEMLERVKHMFDIPNTCFVFGLNRVGLRKSIEVLYGHGKDESDIYLNRFFDLAFKLPQPDTSSFGKMLIEKYKLKQFKSYQASLQSKRVSDYYSIPYSKDSIDDFLPDLFSCYNLSLRDVDYCFRMMLYFQKSHPHNNLVKVPSFLGALLLLKIKFPEIYDKYLFGVFYGVEVLEDMTRGFSNGTFPKWLCDKHNERLILLRAFFMSVDNSDIPDSMPRQRLNALANSTAMQIRSKKTEEVFYEYTCLKEIIGNGRGIKPSEILDIIEIGVSEVSNDG